MDELRSGGASEGHDFNIENPLWGKRYLSRRQLMHGAGGLVALGLAGLTGLDLAAVRPQPGWVPKRTELRP